MLPAQPTKVPKNLGRFEVGAKIGGGGMATVYLGRAVREDGSEEIVALKVIRDELAHDEQFSAMFIDEAKILARLSHPNVIQTLEYGISGVHRFIAMELLSGRTVADAWDVLVGLKERFDVGDAAWVCARVAEGVHSAHELVDESGSPLSVIHRDVNPTNIFLTHSGEVKLIDFGLARARVRVSKSADGIVKGKIPYLAPEQAYGQPIDRRIDLYALGTTLWEMVTMKRLFKRDNDIDTLKAIRDAHVPDPREENPDFPEALWKIIDRALKRDREERYQTAEEMRTDLDAFARASGPHGPRVATLVGRLFPGGEARHAKWLRDAAAVRIPVETMVPPAPLPIASSSLLDEDNQPPSLRSEPPPPVETEALGTGRLPPPRLPPKRIDDEAGTRSGTPPPLPAEDKAEDKAKAEEKSDAKADRPEEPKEPEAPPASEPATDAEDAAPPSRADKAPLKKARAKDRPAKKKASAAKKKRRRLLPSADASPEDKRRLYLIVAAVVGVLLVLAILANR